MQENKIILNGKNFLYRSSGEGVVIVLLHGFGEDGSVWKNQFEVFNDYRLIIPDLPGSGNSEMTEDMSMEGMAKTIYDFLTYLKIESCILVGHSMGGYITLAYVEKFSHTLKGFGLFHSSSYADNDEKKETRKKGIAFIKEHGAYEFLKTSIPNLYSPLTKEAKPGLIADQISNSKEFSGPALIAYYEAMMARSDRTELLKKTSLPVLFIMGKYDNAVPMKDSLEQCHLPAVSQVQILENSGHMGMVEEAAPSNQAMKDYFSFVFSQK